MGKHEFVTQSSWQSLRQFTAARVAMGRCGCSVPTDELLAFKLAHAKAMDAVHQPLDFAEVAEQVELRTGLDTLRVSSAAWDRTSYLQRPDLGRMLSLDSVARLQNHPKREDYDVALVVADGLSSAAIAQNLAPMLSQFVPLLLDRGISIAPVCLVEQARVAVGDEVAQLLNARVVIVLIGERPGLKSPNSMGIYLTFEPQTGTTDERRNCISNVRPNGLSYAAASFKLLYLLEEAIRRKISGVDLKDEQSPDSLAVNRSLFFPGNLGAF